MDEDFATAFQSGARELADQTDLPPVRLIREQGDQRRRRRAVGSVGVVLVAAIAIGVGVVHFSGGGQHGLVPPTSTPSSSESPDAEGTTTTATPKVSETPSNAPTSTKQPTTTQSTSTTQSKSLPDCTMAQLKITPGQNDAGAGHSAQPLLFLNAGSTACRLHGYPEVKALDAQGHVMAQARQTPSGYMGGLWDDSTPPPSVDLSPGQSASALFETLNFNLSDGSACAAYSSLQVTAPNGTGSVTLHVPPGGCSNPQIHPVVPGDNGREVAGQPTS